MDPDTVMRFVRKLHENPAIWDMQCKLHNNVVAIDECWQNISEDMGISSKPKQLKFLMIQKMCSICTFHINTEEELQTMWKNIIHTYKLHLRRQLNPDTEADLTVIVPKEMASNILFIANNSPSPVTEVLKESSQDTLIIEDGNLISVAEANKTQLKRRRNIDIAAALEIVRNATSERTSEAHFLLSLVPHLERVPTSRRLSCEIDIIETIKRYLKN